MSYILEQCLRRESGAVPSYKCSAAAHQLSVHCSAVGSASTFKSKWSALAFVPDIRVYSGILGYTHIVYWGTSGPLCDRAGLNPDQCMLKLWKYLTKSLNKLILARKRIVKFWMVEKGWDTCGRDQLVDRGMEESSHTRVTTHIKSCKSSVTLEGGTWVWWK